MKPNFRFALSAATGVSLLALASAAWAQQTGVMAVTLMPKDRGMVDAARVATKDIVSHVVARAAAARPGTMLMVNLQSCPGVAADVVQGLRQDLQKRRLMVVIDLNHPAPGLCKG